MVEWRYPVGYKSKEAGGHSGVVYVQSGRPVTSFSSGMIKEMSGNATMKIFELVAYTVSLEFPQPVWLC